MKMKKTRLVPLVWTETASHAKIMQNFLEKAGSDGAVYGFVKNMPGETG
jgi:hypothetical protein